ncbi:MAG: hypothetical protein R3A46_10780 [Thermomicrobiales bacterium]
MGQDIRDEAALHRPATVTESLTRDEVGRLGDAQHRRDALATGKKGYGDQPDDDRAGLGAELGRDPGRPEPDDGGDRPGESEDDADQAALAPMDDR